MDVETVNKYMPLFSESGMSAPEYALAFHKEMQRWRSLDELPEDGQRIEVACHYPGMDLISEVDDFVKDAKSNTAKWGLADDDQTPIAWRPAGPLPDLRET